MSGRQSAHCERPRMLSFRCIEGHRAPESHPTHVWYQPAPVEERPQQPPPWHPRNLCGYWTGRQQGAMRTSPLYSQNPSCYTPGPFWGIMADHNGTAIPCLGDNLLREKHHHSGSWRSSLGHDSGPNPHTVLPWRWTGRDVPAPGCGAPPQRRGGGCGRLAWWHSQQYAILAIRLRPCICAHTHSACRPSHRYPNDHCHSESDTYLLTNLHIKSNTNANRHCHPNSHLHSHSQFHCHAHGNSHTHRAGHRPHHRCSYWLYVRICAETAAGAAGYQPASPGLGRHRRLYGERQLTGDPPVQGSSRRTRLHPLESCARQPRYALGL